jgi:hypothetical protein
VSPKLYRWRKAVIQEFKKRTCRLDNRLRGYVDFCASIKFKDKKFIEDSGFGLIRIYPIFSVPAR